MIGPSNLLSSVKAECVSRLSEIYPLREAENMVNLLINHFTGMTRVDQQLYRDRKLSESEMILYNKSLNRLLRHEPIQYVLGTTEFCGLTLRVGPQVLIPRPETEQLVDFIVKEELSNGSRVLDVGTGSGCIALAIKQARKQWLVTGVDISDGALDLARQNAWQTGLSVDFKSCNILETEQCLQSISCSFRLIVSNPPYVLESEKRNMAKNVLNYEPAGALFVPDTDPLLFYRKIRDLADQALLSGGWLYFELNEQWAGKTAKLFHTKDYLKPEVFSDFHGKERFLRVRKR